MKNIMQMILNQKMQQIPQQMMIQLENQLKRVNPQAYQEYQKARQNNDDPQAYLNKVVDGFNPQQKQQWNSMMGNFMQQNNNINAEKLDINNK